MSRSARVSSKTSRKAQRGARGRDSDALLQQAVVAHRAGRLEEAERGYRAIKSRDPNYAEALRLRGLLAHQQQRTQDAVKLLRRALASQPSNPVAHHSLAEILRAAGRLAEAAEGYRRAWALQPTRHATGIELAETLTQLGDGEGALAAYHDVIRACPGHPEAHERAARLLYERGAPLAAHELLESWVAASPGEAPTRRLQARAFSGIGAPGRAAELYRGALDNAPDDALAHAGLGGALQSQGDFAGARLALERAIELQPDLGWAHAALMSDRGYQPTADRERAMVELAAAPNTPPQARTHLHFALGGLYDRRAEPASAIEHFQVGNRLHAQAEPFDATRFDDRIERILQTFTRDFFAARQGFGHASDRPVFVVGMPRSGTSLVEQIVASHPQAHGAGELDDLRRIVRELPFLTGGASAFPECTADLDSAQAMALAERYLGALDARAPDAARVTDKMPFNMLWLGLVALLLPNARVIYCRREAMDNCLSCYFQIFSQGLRFAYDLGQLGRVYRQHERLMAHWQQCLPLDMLTVDYEALVADPERQTRRLIEFVDLPWDESCLDFHHTERNVRTASVWQVRQPVYRSSVERWRAYEPWLGPLRDGLAAPL